MIVNIIMEEDDDEEERDEGVLNPPRRLNRI